MTKFSFLTLALLAGMGCAAVACSSDGDDTSPAAGGAGGSGGKAATGGSGGKGGGTAEAGAGGGSSLYERLGGNSGIASAVDAIVAAEVMDTDIASYFSQQANPKYSPSVADIKECLVLQLGHAAGGPEIYPGDTSSGFTCRNMAAAHEDLGINGDTFDMFVTIAAGVLTKAGVLPDDVSAIGMVLDSTKTSIVTDKTTVGEKACTAPSACAVAGASSVEAGGAGGAGGAG